MTEQEWKERKRSTDRVYDLEALNIKLQHENERLRKALEEIADYSPNYDEGFRHGYSSMKAIAFQALGK